MRAQPPRRASSLSARRTNRALIPSVMSLAITVALAAAADVHAATPDAGSTLDSLRQPPTLARPLAPMLPQAPDAPVGPGSADLQAQLTVQQLQIIGASVFSAEELQAVVADAIGQRLSVADLRTLAGRITQYYRQRGYLLAWAYLPPQTIAGGRVEIRVLEGRLGEVQLRNGSRLPDAVLTPTPRLRAGEVLTLADIERAVLLLDDLAGVRVRATLAPGAAVGSSDVVLTAEATPRLSGSAELDNHGNHYTGATRLGGALSIASPLQRGDRLDLRLLSTGHGMSFARADWATPLGHDGLRVGANLSALHYQLGAELASLDASGSAQVLGFGAQQSLVRSSANNLLVSAALEHKTLDDRVGSAAADTRKRADLISVTLAGDHNDDARSAYGSLTWTHGRLAIRSADALAQDAASARSNGSFDKLNAAALTQWWLGERHSLYASLSVQLAGKNLDSSERLSLGGAAGVRAYPQGEAAGDSGALASVEWRYAMAPGWQAAALLDAGHVKLHQRAWDDSANSRSLAGAGFGLQAQPAPGWQLRASLAWRVRGSAATAGPDHRPRLAAQAAFNF